MADAEAKIKFKDAKTYWDKKGIPVLVWHWRDPSKTTEAFYTKNSSKPNGTSFDICKINDTASIEYKVMLSDIDFVSGMLKELQVQNVPVIWRPLYKAAGGWFWWGAKGSDASKKIIPGHVRPNGELQWFKKPHLGLKKRTQ